MKYLIIKDYPQLYKKDKNDRTRVWKIQAIKTTDDNSFWISTTHGVQDGKLISTKKQVEYGKNIGKSNETSIEEQLLLVCNKTFKDKVEKEEYIETLDRLNEDKISKCFAPMLAATWDPNSQTKRKVDIVFPCFIQPKLDGIRCLVYEKDSIIVNQSRQLKYFKNLDHINSELEVLLSEYEDLVLDGELYNHDIEFNNIAGIVKKEKLNDSDRIKLLDIQYHVYDMFVDNEKMPFEDRLKFLQNKIKKFKYVKLVPTYECKKVDDVKEYHSKFIGASFEGSILRNKSAAYEFTRSKHLQKFKDFLEDEFIIIGFKEGTGHDKGTVIWRCKTKDNNEFDVRPVGTVEERKALYEDGSSYVGQLLTVKYQELSPYGIPRFGVGLRIRDYE
jgi:DNA ligase-1